MNLLISFSANAITDALKVKIVNGTFTDEAVIRFLPNATNNFDSGCDAWKLFSSNPLAPAVFTDIDAQSHLSINALPSLSKKTVVDLNIKVPTSGVFTLQALELGGFLPGASIMLEDKMTGMIYSFRKGSIYTINLLANTLATSNRFALHFSPPTNVAFTNVTCYGLTNGALTITKSGNTNWSYQLKDNTGGIVQVGSTINETTTIAGLNVGAYTIETFSSFTANDTNSFVITQPNVIVADYEVDSAGNMIAPYVPILFENYSSGATSYTWNFGDGSPIATQTSPIHQYAEAGTYVVTLTASNLTCDVSYSNTIVVHPFITTNVASFSSEENTLTAFQQDEMLVINSQTKTPSQMIINIFNTLGQNVYSFSADNTTSVFKSVSLPVTGTYFVTLNTDNNRINRKVTYIK